jgi:Mn-dependent DtxR family transcriptional regulator
MEKSDVIYNYLLKKYRDNGQKEFFFSSKKLARHLQCSAHSIGWYLSDLYDAGLIEHYNKVIWKTCFNLFYAESGF